MAEKQVICARNRSCANIHFRVGGLLLYRKQYAEAKNQLEQALHQCDKWSGLQSTLMKAIQKCQEHLTKTEKDMYTDASSSIFRFVSPKERDTVMDAAFFPSKETALGASLSVTLPTSNTTTNPFTFAATFPKATHVVGGDTVTDSVSLKSHLLIPVSISMQLL